MSTDLIPPGFQQRPVMDVVEKLLREKQLLQTALENCMRVIPNVPHHTGEEWDSDLRESHRLGTRTLYTTNPEYHAQTLQSTY